MSELDRKKCDDMVSARGGHWGPRKSTAQVAWHIEVHAFTVHRMASVPRDDLNLLSLHFYFTSLK